MLHFIPAWYQENLWCENEQKWYVRRMHTEFDDTVKQIQLFHRSQAYPYQIMLLGFSPNFRHFLHRQGVYHAPYWSCFDAIQQVRRKKAMLLSFHNMKWPEHIQFIYTPFVVAAMLNGEKYAQIEFGEDGNPIQIDLFQDGAVSRRNFYDDRGFVSGTIVFRQGKPYYQDYLMENGKWKLRCFLDDGHVEVNQKYPDYLLAYSGVEENRTFSRLRYDRLDQVIQEVLSSYLELVEGKDLFCIAMDPRHVGLLTQVLKGRRTILSFYENRYPLDGRLLTAEMVTEAGYLVTDSLAHSRKIRKVLGKESQKITDISPYDTRVDFGISGQLDVQKILVPVDGMGDGLFEQLIKGLGQYLCVNDNARVHLFTRRADYGWQSRLLEKVSQCLKAANLSLGWVAKQEEGGTAENDLEGFQGVKPRFFVEQCVDELSVSKCMKEQRLLVDLRKAPALYLQILAISVGIPQIVAAQTQFVEHGRNGLIVKEIGMLEPALEYYLNGRSNWNDAMVRSYELGRKYTSSVLMEKWKEVIRSFG